MRLAEAKARRTVVLRNSSFNPRMLKAQWLQWESSYPTSWSQSGNESGHGGCSLFTERLPALRGNGHGNGSDINFSVDGNDPLSSLCSGKLRTYGASSQVDMSRTPSQTLPFEAYKRFVQGFRAPMSVRDCKAPLSDTPEAITHDGSKFQVRPGIAYISCRGTARRCLQQFRQVWEPRLDSGRWVSLMLAPPWSLITLAVTFLDRRKCIRASCWSAGSEEQQAMRVLALANRSTSALP